MIKMSDIFGFVNDLEKIIYGLGFKLKLKRNNNDRALYRVHANPVQLLMMVIWKICIMVCT